MILKTENMVMRRRMSKGGSLALGNWVRLLQYFEEEDNIGHTAESRERHQNLDHQWFR